MPISMSSPEQKVLSHLLSETCDMIIILYHLCIRVLTSSLIVSQFYFHHLLSPHFSVLFASPFLPHLLLLSTPVVLPHFPVISPVLSHPLTHFFSVLSSSPHLSSTFLQAYDSSFSPTSFYRFSALPSCTPFPSHSSTFYSLDRYRFSEPKSN